MTDKKTLEEALAEMEASNAKAAELRAKNAPELIAQAEARTALNARLTTVTYQQAWRCEYNYAGQTFWRVFTTSCPSSIEIQ